MGLIFTRGDLKEVSEEVAKYKVRLIAFYIQIPGDFFFFNHFRYYWILKT